MREPTAPVSPIEVVIPGRPDNVLNARRAWRVAARMKAARREQVGWLARQARGRRRPADGPRHATATLYLAGQLRDADNATASLAADVNGLRDSGVIRDDDPASLTLTVRQERVRHRAEERVVWRISADA